MKMRILVPDHFGKEHINRIRAVSNSIEVSVISIQKQLNGFHGLLHRFLPLIIYNKFAPFFHKSKPTYNITIDGKDINSAQNDIQILLASWVINSDILGNLLQFLPNLQWIHSTVNGINHLLYSEIVNNNNIQLTSSKGIHSTPVAEFVLSLILTFLKRIPEHINFQQKRKWQSLETDDLTDKTVGIIGLGNIGREVAKKVKNIGMKVVAIKKEPVKVSGVDTIFPPEGLKELLRISDFVVISAPLTKETQGIIGEAELKIMKRNGYVINVSREEIVQRDALIKALKDRWIAGASIDAFHQQPLPLNSPYYSLPNFIITHHSAYFTSRANARIFDFFLVNLKRFFAGDELLGMVDKRKGY